MTKAKKKAKPKGGETVKLTVIPAAELPAGNSGAPAPVKFDPRQNLKRGHIKAPVPKDLKAAGNPRQAILTAFGEVGGVVWLKKLAKRYPKDFVSLLAKAMPTDINVTGTMGYAPMPVPVEERDAIPGEFTVLPGAPAALESEPDPFM